MGLLTKEVEVTLCGANIKYFENLGYKIPRIKDKYSRLVVPRGTKIKVLIADLLVHSNVYVDVDCDCCGKQYKLQYDVYNSHNHDGKTYCVNCAARMLISGENNYNWNPDLTDKERVYGRHIDGYVDFIKKVLERDNHTCQCCGLSFSNKMEAHHLNGYDWFIEGRTDETNGITLCKLCHKNFHRIYGYGENTKEQFEEWLGRAIKTLKYNGTLPTAKRIFCVEDNKLYDDATVISKKFCINKSKIYDVCNHKQTHIHGYHFLWEDEYKNISDEDLYEILTRKYKYPNSKMVVCLTTGKIFENIKSASVLYNINSSGDITTCCKGRQKSAGKLPDGTKLKWIYYEDFLKLPIEEQNKILSRNVEPSFDSSFNLK